MQKRNCLVWYYCHPLLPISWIIVCMNVPWNAFFLSTFNFAQLTWYYLIIQMAIIHLDHNGSSIRHFHFAPLTIRNHANCIISAYNVSCLVILQTYFHEHACKGATLRVNVISIASDRMRVLLLSSFLLLLAPNIDGAAKCRRPNGNEGAVIVQGCTKKTCTKTTGKKGVWIEAPSTCV